MYDLLGSKPESNPKTADEEFIRDETTAMLKISRGLQLLARLFQGPFIDLLSSEDRQLVMYILEELTEGVNLFQEARWQREEKRRQSLP